MTKQNSFMTFSNRIMGWILRSPMHSMMSKSTMLISVTGLKTGKTIQTPVNYLRLDDNLYTTSAKTRTWWRNLRGGKPCKLWLQGKEVSAQGTVLETPVEVEPILARYLQASPESGRFLGVTVSADGKIDSVELAKAAAERIIIRFVVSPESN